MKRFRWSSLGLYLLLVGYAVLTVVPFLWALSASFKPLAEIAAGGNHLIPQQFTLENYKTIFGQEPLFGRWLWNSAIAAICVTLLNLLFNSMAGYALARIRFFWKPILVFDYSGGIDDSGAGDITA